MKNFVTMRMGRLTSDDRSFGIYVYKTLIFHKVV